MQIAICVVASRGMTIEFIRAELYPKLRRNQFNIEEKDDFNFPVLVSASCALNILPSPSKCPSRANAISQE
jgi:hypothetical protein